MFWGWSIPHSNDVGLQCIQVFGDPPGLTQFDLKRLKSAWQRVGGVFTGSPVSLHKCFARFVSGGRVSCYPQYHHCLPVLLTRSTSRLRTDLYCVEWDVKLYYMLNIFIHVLLHPSVTYGIQSQSIMLQYCHNLPVLASLPTFSYYTASSHCTST